MQHMMEGLLYTTRPDRNACSGTVVDIAMAMAMGIEFIGGWLTVEPSPHQVTTPNPTLLFASTEDQGFDQELNLLGHDRPYVTLPLIIHRCLSYTKYAYKPGSKLTMPQLDLATPTGPVDWHYNISTPTLAFSPAIIPELPCVLFLHGSYGASGQDIFEPQFSDPRLREHLNLIGVDMRSFGGTKGAITREHYTPAVAADDVYRFMQTLPLPPVHVFALSIGGCVALELAMAHPDVVLSLTLCSPLPLTEPEDVAAGRVEVMECFERSLVHQGNPSTQLEAETSDPIMLDDMVFGYQQLVFNNYTNRMIDAQTKNALGLTKAGWGGSPELLDVARIVGHEWYVNRKAYPLESLAKINCPISLIHCADDVAYPIKYAQELQLRLREAGRTDVFLYQISGPHFGCVVNAQALNPILRDFVLSVEKQSPQPEPQPESEFRRNMVTPFTAMLARHGYDPFSDSDSEGSFELESDK